MVYLRPYDVAYFSHTFFLRFDHVHIFKSIRLGRHKGDANVTDLRVAEYTANVKRLC